MKKRLSLLLLVTILALSLVACGSEDDADVTNEEKSNEFADVVVDTAELLANVNARKAIALSFDKDYIAEEILKDGSVGANYFVPEGFVTNENGEDFRDAYPTMLENDYDAAKEYWELAKEELEFGKATIEILTYDHDNGKKMAEYIQGQLEANLDGLTVNINQQPFENKIELGNKGDFDIDLAGWGPDYPDALTFLNMWVTEGGYNKAGYSNETYDENIENARIGEVATQSEERWALLQETERMLIEDDVLLVPIYQRGRAIIQQPGLTGIQYHTFGGDYTYKYAESTREEDGKSIAYLEQSSDIPTMDLSLATDATSFEVLANVTEPLYTLGENDVVEPGVATGHEVSEDGLVYTFTLREDAVWSNGDAVTANDFVYSWKRLVNPATASEYAWMAETAGILNAGEIAADRMDVDELGVVALDDYTLEVTLEYPIPYFDKLMTFPSFAPLNEEFVEAQGDKHGTSVETTLYNGPFVLSEWTIGYEYELEKNPTYWDADAVTIDVVNFRIVKDIGTGVNLYNSGDLDRTKLSQEYVDEFLDDPNLSFEKQTAIFYLLFNVGNYNR